MQWGQRLQRLSLIALLASAGSVPAAQAQVSRIIDRQGAQAAYDKTGTAPAGPIDQIITHCMPTLRASDPQTCRKERYDLASKQFVAVSDWYQQSGSGSSGDHGGSEPGHIETSDNASSGSMDFTTGSVAASRVDRSPSYRAGQTAKTVMGSSYDAFGSESSSLVEMGPDGMLRDKSDVALSDGAGSDGSSMGFAAGSVAASQVDRSPSYSAAQTAKMLVDSASRLRTAGSGRSSDANSPQSKSCGPHTAKRVQTGKASDGTALYNWEC